jgi:hypothetical protein
MGLTEPLSDGISAGPMVAKLTDPLGASEELLARTKTFRHRVKGENGSIEDDSMEGLYDPILRTVKGFSGVGLSDLVLFVSASAVEINSGSIPTLFDASGNEYDAIQTTTADQPTLDKNSIGGRWGAVLDGGDDQMISNNSFATSPATHFWVASLNTSPSTEAIVDGNVNNTNSTRQIIRSLSSDWQVYDTDLLTDGTADQNDHIFEAVFDGASSELIIDGKSVVQGNAGDGTFKDMTIGSNRGGGYWKGLINEGIVLDSKLSANQRSKIRSHIQDWYSL